MFFTFTTMKKQHTPVIRPIQSAPMGVTKPEAGVIPTRPATAPEMPPSADGFPLRVHSAASQPSAAEAAAKCVLTKAEVARPLAPSAEPALNPNQPTQSRQAPMKLSTTECGGIAFC